MARRLGVSQAPVRAAIREPVLPGFLALRHKELLEALASRDPQKAVHAMQHHIEDLGKPPQLPAGVAGEANGRGPG